MLNVAQCGVRLGCVLGWVHCCRLQSQSFFLVAAAPAKMHLPPSPDRLPTSMRMMYTFIIDLYTYSCKPIFHVPFVRGREKKKNGRNRRLEKKVVLDKRFASFFFFLLFSSASSSALCPPSSSADEFPVEFEFLCRFANDLVALLPYWLLYVQSSQQRLVWEKIHPDTHTHRGWMGCFYRWWFSWFGEKRRWQKKKKKKKHRRRMSKKGKKNRATIAV